MVINLDKSSFLIFDLDDTLYPEIEFLESGYKHIAEKLLPVTKTNIYEEMMTRYWKKENVFKWIVFTYSHYWQNLTIDSLLQIYREHIPDIKPYRGVVPFFEALNERRIPLGLITDGRSITQRNKLKALGLSGYFNDIIISEEFGSEKPNEKNYMYFVHKYQGKKFFFFGDNTSKDFIVPLRLGWTTVCLKNHGRNIHDQNFDSETKPELILDSFEELKSIFYF